MGEIALRATSLRKVYGGIVALEGVDFELRAAEIHGLCGENGAGKSTLVKILGGFVAPTAGEVEVYGTVLKRGRRTDPRLISIVHQELSIVPDLTVLDNVLLGDNQVGEICHRRRFAGEVRARLDQLGLDHVPLSRPARGLTLAEQQLVEITRGVMRGARILILDEPTATLSDAEIRRVFRAVRFLREGGTTIVFISHRLNEVNELTDRVTVFRNGRRVLTKQTAALAPGELVSAMIGRTHERRSAAAPVLRETRLQLEGLAMPGRLEAVSLTVPAGQVLGVVGQLGSGADAVVECLAGLRPRHSGVVRLDGAAVRLARPIDAMRAGIAYVPEDRAAKGVFLDASVAVNTTTSILGRLSRFGFIRFSAADQEARRLARQFRIDPRRLPSEVSQLSGGNQQKVSIARAVALQPRLLVLNEPTRGVDIGARAEIYRQLHALAASGMSVIFFTTDLEEVQELADRVVTVFRGRVVTDRAIAEASAEVVLADVLHGPDRRAA